MMALAGNPFEILLMVFLVLAAKYWYVTVTVAVLLAILGRVCRGWLGKTAFVLAGMTLLSACVLPVVDLSKRADEKAEAARFEREAQPFPAPRTLDGIVWPAGTRAHFDYGRELATVDLPGPALVLGVQLEGHLEHDVTDGWTAMLLHDTLIEGWPCKAGAVTLRGQSANGTHLARCTLAQDHVSLNRTLPRDTQMVLDTTDGSQTLTLPADRSLALPEIQSTAPGGSDVHLYGNGEAETVDTGAHAALTVRGLALVHEVSFDYAYTAAIGSDTPLQPVTMVSGELAKPVVCAGTTLQAGSIVHLHLDHNTVATAAAGARDLSFPLACVAP